MKTRKVNSDRSLPGPIATRRSPIQDPEGSHLQTAPPYQGSGGASQTNRKSAESMAAKASKGIYPECVPFGYCISAADGSIEIHDLESQIVRSIFEVCASGDHSTNSISDMTGVRFGVQVSEANIRAILEDCFYIGIFEWAGHWYLGTHPLFLERHLFYRAQAFIKRLDSFEAHSDKDSANWISFAGIKFLNGHCER
jgi:hypothetical protein